MEYGVYGDLYYNAPKAIFYLLKAGYKHKRTHIWLNVRDPLKGDTGLCRDIMGRL